MKSRCSLLIPVMILLPFVAFCDDQDQKALDQYVKPGLTLSTERILPSYPSEREPALAVAKQPMRWLDLPTLQSFPFLKDSRIGRPVAVRVLGRYYTHQAAFDRYYYYFVPIFHPDLGLVASFLYEKAEDVFTHKVSFELTEFSAGVHLNPKRLEYLIDGEEAKQLLENTLNIKTDGKPFAVWTGLGSYPNSLQGWFWYVRCRSGFPVDGKTVHSFFVNPYAFVPDIHSVTPEVLLDPKYTGPGFITQRFYTLETDEDYYALSDAEIKGKSNLATAQLFAQAAEKTIVPPTIRPLLVDSQGHGSLGLINDGR